MEERNGRPEPSQLRSYPSWMCVKFNIIIYGGFACKWCEFYKSTFPSKKKTRIMYLEFELLRCFLKNVFLHMYDVFVVCLIYAQFVFYYAWKKRTIPISITPFIDGSLRTLLLIVNISVGVIEHGVNSIPTKKYVEFALYQSMEKSKNCGVIFCWDVP